MSTQELTLRIIFITLLCIGLGVAIFFAIRNIEKPRKNVWLKVIIGMIVLIVGVALMLFHVMSCNIGTIVLFSLLLVLIVFNVYLEYKHKNEQ